MRPIAVAQIVAEYEGDPHFLCKCSRGKPPHPRGKPSEFAQCAEFSQQINFEAGNGLFCTGWFFYSLMTELAIMLVVRTYRPFQRSRSERLLLTSTLVVMVLTFAIPYLPCASDFGFAPVSARMMTTLLNITALYVAASELAKWLVDGRR